MAKTRRHSAYADLRAGHAFLPFEARPLSKIPRDVCPYFDQLVADRRKDVRIAVSKGLTTKQYEGKVKELYAKNDWLSLNKKGEKVADPWKMLRAYEDAHRQRQPDYSSPWEARMRRWRDFQAKLERTLATQRGVA